MPVRGQCGGRQPRAPILRYAEHASRAKSLIRHFVGTRHRILRANAGFGKTPSLARILAAKGPVSAIMFPVERASPNNIDSRERFYDSLFAPTTNRIRPWGSMNDSLCVPAAHWWLSGNVKLGLIWGSVVHCDVFVLVCCAFCMLGNVHLMFLEVLDTHLVKVQGGGYFFWRRLS